MSIGSRKSMSLVGCFAALLGLLLGLSGCGGDNAGGKPNIIWIVWSNVRPDHLSLNGYPKPTTPFLDEWAKNARVYDNCMTVSNCPISSHVSLVTGLLPSEHGVHQTSQRVDRRLTTLAEVLSEAGYRTFLYVADPAIVENRGYFQGYDRGVHPWSDRFRPLALRIVKEKVAADVDHLPMADRIWSGEVRPGDLKATGQLARMALLEWLTGSDANKPFFAFLEYMEAHSSLVPPREYRERFMSPEEVARSYEIDASWETRWSYTFGFSEYSEDDLRLIRATYDAAIAELDVLLSDLLGTLAAGGYLENTVVVLTSDHGTMLGERHMMGYEYSLHNLLLRIPLLVHYPRRLSPGRDLRPAMNTDLSPTMLQLIGLNSQAAGGDQSMSLLKLPEVRIRISEYLSPLPRPLEWMKELHPSWDSEMWNRELRSVLHEPYKFIWASDGNCEMYHLGEDPLELRNLYAEETEISQSMLEVLESHVTLHRPASNPTE